jgi:hypothetical protein
VTSHDPNRLALRCCMCAMAFLLIYSPLAAEPCGIGKLSSFLGSSCTVGNVEFTFGSYQGNISPDQLVFNPNTDSSTSSGFTLSGISLMGNLDHPIQSWNGSLQYGMETMGGYDVYDLTVDPDLRIVSGLQKASMTGLTATSLYLAGAGDFYSEKMATCQAQSEVCIASILQDPYLHSRFKMAYGSFDFSGGFESGPEPGSFTLAPNLRLALIPSPEPGTFALFGTGCAALLGWVRRRRKSLRSTKD